LNGGLVFNVARQSWYWDAVCGTNGIITQPFSGPYPTESAWLGGCSSQNGMGYRWVPGHLGKSVPPDVGQVATCATSSIAGSLIGLDMALTGDQGATCTTPTGVTVPIFKLPVTGPNQEQTQTDILGVLRGILTGLGQLPGKIVDEIKARIIPPLPVAHQTDTVITLNPLTHPNLDPGGVGHVSLFPFSVPWDLKAIASALDVSPTAPSWSLAWKNPLDGSTITTTTIGFTEFCLGSTCFQLLDRDLGAGVTPMVLVRWAELMLLVIGVGLRLRDWMGDGW
jgi:hypothetical protein